MMMMLPNKEAKPTSLPANKPAAFKPHPLALAIAIANAYQLTRK